MAKAFLRLTLWLGLVLFIAGIFFGAAVLIIGLIMVLVAIGIASSPDGVLRADQVIDTWAALIEKANGKAEEVVGHVNDLLKESKAPSLLVGKKSIAPSWMKGVVGKNRDFLVVTDGRSSRLEPYQIFMNARDYGENLDTSWYLTYRPTTGQIIMSLFFGKSGFIPKSLSDLDIFDQQDLRAYVTNAHKCMEKAVEKIMFDNGQDPSKIDWKSKGFLGVS